MTKKLLSILIPNYNHAQYLSECLSSALSYPTDEIEVVVTDDASTDHSVEIMQSFAKKDPRLKVIQNQVNRGVNQVLNAALRELEGEFVFGLSADDKLLPHFFPDVLALLKKHPQIDLCTSDFSYFQDETPEKIEVQSSFKTTEPYLLLTPDETLEKFKTTSFWIPGNSSVMRKDLAIEYGGYQEALRQYSDFFLYHKIALTRPIAYIPKPIAMMRVLASSYSATSLANAKLRKETSYRLLDHVLQDETRDRFIESTLLAPMVKRIPYQMLYTPKYWRFLFPLVRKKLRKARLFG